MLGVYILAVSVLSCVIVGLLVVARGLHDKRTIIYGLLTLSLLTLCFMNFLAVAMPENQIVYVRGVMGSTTVAMYLIYLLILELKQRRGIKPFYKTKLFYATVIMFFVDFTDLLFTGVIPGEPPKPIPNFGILFFFGLYISTLIIGIRQLRKDISNATTIDERRRYSLLIAGIIPIVFLAPLTSFVMPNYLGISQFVIATPLYVFVLVSLVGYAIVRHGLFDVRRAVVRTIAYALSIGTLAAMYYLVVYVLSLLLFSAQDSISVNTINVTIALILAFLFQPIKRFFDQATNNIFYRDNYNSEEFFAKLSVLLSSTIDLRGLLERASKEIADTFKAEQASFFVYSNSGTNHYMGAGTRGHAKVPLHDAYLLDDYVAKTNSHIFLTHFDVEDDKIRRLLMSHRIALVMPLMQGGAVAGYLMLGEHKTSNYSKRDLTVLSTVGSELVIAIQNAMSLHKVRELNATLQQRIDVATKELRASNAQLKHLDEVKDEFMSMASHQLRTPLTSIKGYLSMVLEGDAGKITPQQERLLLEAYNSSERMVRLISDFLNVSRLQTGKFLIEKTTFDLRDIVQQEVKELELLAASHSLKLRLNIGKEPLPVHADADKLRQVMMNFIDNAIYYSSEKGTIIINLERIKNDVAFTVVDSGIGVPEAEQAKLFTKFFRAENARKQRPDGTGVGLYLARRVIMVHGGGIIFSSKEGKGSTFGFRLPLDLSKKPVEKPAPALEAAAK